MEAMDRGKILFIVDALLGLAFLSVGVTGILKWPGVGAAFGVP